VNATATAVYADLAEVRARVERAHQEIGDICQGRRRWTMRIPADEASDTDLILSAALKDAETLSAEVEKLRSELAQRGKVNDRAVEWYGHSVMLNSVSYRVAEALAESKGAEQYAGSPITDVERLIGQRDEALAVMAVFRDTLNELVPAGPAATRRDDRVTAAVRIAASLADAVRRAVPSQSFLRVQLARIIAELQQQAGETYVSDGSTNEAEADDPRPVSPPRGTVHHGDVTDTGLAPAEPCTCPPGCCATSGLPDDHERVREVACRQRATPATPDGDGPR